MMMMMAAPPAGGFRPVPQGLWAYNLFTDCCADGTCCAGMCCTCCVFGATIKMIETGKLEPPCNGPNCCNGPCCIMCLLYTLMQGVFNYLWPGAGALISVILPCHAFYACSYRAALRGKYGLPIDCINDCMPWWCCALCASCQEYNEVRNRLLAGPAIVPMMMAPQQVIMNPPVMVAQY